MVLSNLKVITAIVVTIIVLKLFKQIDWPWWLVLAPITLSLLSVIIVVAWCLWILIYNK